MTITEFVAGLLLQAAINTNNKTTAIGVLLMVYYPEGSDLQWLN